MVGIELRKSDLPSAPESNGFTLVELMIVLIVLAILAALAAPSFRDFLISQRIRNAAYELYSDLTYARSEALRTNSEVKIAKATGGWKNGWNVTWGATTLRTHAAFDSAVTVTATQDQILFERNGRPIAGTAAAQFTLDDTGGNAAITARCITVDPSGRPNTTVGACS